MSTPQFLILLAMILLAGSSATPTDKPEATALLSITSGVLVGLAIGERWLW